MPPKKQELSFDQALMQLEQVVKQLEVGNLPLEEAIALYKQGMSLSTACHQKLEKIESDVALLVDSSSAITEFNQKEE